MKLWKTNLILLFLLMAQTAFGQDVIPMRPHKEKESQLVQQLKENEWNPRKEEKNEVEDLTDNQKLAIQIIDFAKTRIGCRYRSGGKGPNAFDCSGFVGYVFRHFGFTMGQSSRDMYLQGIPVKVHDLKPGDLMFFGDHRSTTRIGHVAMVVSVNQETGVVSFIHAASSVGITINKYPDGGYYSRTYIGAKRIL